MGPVGICIVASATALRQWCGLWVCRTASEPHKDGARRKEIRDGDREMRRAGAADQWASSAIVIVMPLYGFYSDRNGNPRKVLRGGAP